MSRGNFRLDWEDWVLPEDVLLDLVSHWDVSKSHCPIIHYKIYPITSDRVVNKAILSYTKLHSTSCPFKPLLFCVSAYSRQVWKLVLFDKASCQHQCSRYCMYWHISTSRNALTPHHTGWWEEDYSIEMATATAIQELVSAAKTDLLRNMDNINTHSL